jgi:hypothetical protein
MTLWTPSATGQRVATWSVSLWTPNATPERAATWSVSLWTPNATPERVATWSVTQARTRKRHVGSARLPPAIIC